MWSIYFLLIMFGVMILIAICKGLIDGLGFKKFSIAVGVIAGIVGGCFLLSGNTLVGGIIISVVLLITIICCIISSKAKKEAEEQQRVNEIKKKEEEKKRNLRKFHEQCEKAGIDKLETESQRRRAILYARECGLEESDIKSVIKGQIESIQTEKARIEKEKSDKIEKEKSDKYKRDAAEQQKMKTPYPYFGQEKRIAVWQEKLDKVNEGIEALEQEIQCLEHNKNVMLNSKFIEPKVDWAVAGGVASAVGGAGAGVMAALDAMAKNERIEQRNEENIKLMVNYTTFNIKAQQRYQEIKREELKKRWEYEDKIKEIKLKLVDKIEIDNPIDLLKIKNVEVTENSFNVEIALKKKAVIFDDVNAVIDGTFWAHVYQEKEYIGSVRVILPYEGLNTKAVKLSIDTSLGINPEKESYIEYEAEKLWFIER